MTAKRGDPGGRIEAIAAKARAKNAESPPDTKPKTKPQGTIPKPKGVVLRCLADVKPQPIRWLWPGRIALGKISMIYGDPGLGKSQITAYLAGVVSRGGEWPVDGTRCDPGNVVILSAEDSEADTIRPRLDAVGANISRCFVLSHFNEKPEKGGEFERPFSLRSDMEWLSKALKARGQVRLLIIDPVTAYLDGVDSHKNSDVRALLSPLADLADELNLAVVLVSHNNKSMQHDALNRAGGSTAFVAQARAAFMVVKDQKNPDRRLFLPTKNNLGNDRTGCAFTISGHTLPNGIETSCVVWGQEAVTMTADEALAVQAENRNTKSRRESAKQFLEELLADGPLPAEQVQAEAESAGHSVATLRRAKEELGIIKERDGYGSSGIWSWKLPPEVLNATIDAQIEDP